MIRLKLKIINLALEKSFLDKHIDIEETYSISYILEQLKLTKYTLYWDRSQTKQVYPGKSAIQLQKQYGTHWTWYTKINTSRLQLLGGDYVKTEWIINGIIAFLFWGILMVTGFTSLFAEYYRVGIEKVILLTDRFLTWNLGPEDPFLFIVRKFIRTIGWFISVATSFLLIWYLCAQWSYGLFYMFYDNCRATYIQNIFGNIIATIYSLYFVLFSSGTWIIEKIKDMSNLPVIGPLMIPFANISQKVLFSIRKPRFIPYYGPIVSGYFDGLEKEVPQFAHMIKPIQTVMSNLQQFIPLSTKEPFISIIKQLDAEKIMKYLSYGYLSLPEKMSKNFDFKDKMTARFIEWVFTSISAGAAGGMYLLTNICSGDKLRKLEEELVEIISNDRLDPAIRKIQLHEKRLELKMERETPHVNDTCIIDKIESGALAGHTTIVWTFFLAIIFLIFPPTP